MKPIRQMSRAEFGAYVFNLLKSQGINMILSGGSCVSIYTDEAYASGDLGFIQTGLVSRHIVENLLLKHGFECENRYFKHAETHFFIEFPGGPPSIGETPICDFNILKTDTGELHMLTPTDCVKDRLAAYYHWEDDESLEHAVLVTKNQPVDMADIESWSINEGKEDVFRRIRSRLANPKS